MQCNYTVLKKISETCYPPSLFGKSLPELLYMGSTVMVWFSSQPVASASRSPDFHSKLKAARELAASLTR